jgi:hypothetical protein
MANIFAIPDFWKEAEVTYDETHQKPAAVFTLELIGMNTQK